MAPVHDQVISTGKGQEKKTHGKSVIMTLLCESRFLKLQVWAH